MKTITRTFPLNLVFALTLCCLTAFVLATTVSSDSPRNASPAKAKAAIRNFDIGQGPKTYTFHLGRETTTQYNGATALRQAIETGQVQPRTMISDDFNGDGMGDLVIGYQKGGAGVLGMRQGNLQAISPTDPNVFQGITEGRYPSPFLPEVKLYSLPEAPDFLQFGDFNSDGYPDVMTAARGGQKLYLLTGDGRGNLGEPQTIEVPGLVTEMRAGTEQVGTFTKLALGLSMPGGAQLAVYNKKEDLEGEPEGYPMTGDVNGLAFDQLDGDGIEDLGASSSGEVVVVHGRSLEPAPTSDIESVGEAPEAKPAFVERRNVSFAIRGLATGNFIFDRNHQREIALLSDQGTVHLLSQGSPDTRPYSKAERQTMAKLRRSFARDQIDMETLMAETNKLIRPNQAAGWNVAQTIDSGAVYTGTGKTVFLRSNSTSGPLDELLIGDGLNNRVQVVTNEVDVAKLKRTRQSSYAKEIPVTTAPIAAVSMRLTVGARPGTVVLEAKQIEPTIVILAPHSFTVNSTADLPDTVPTAANNTCLASNGLCTLRAAIMQSNHSGGENTIMVPDGTYTLTLGPPDDEANTGGATEQSGDLDIFDWSLFDGSPQLNSVSIVGGTRDGCIVQMGTLSPTLATNVPNNKERILEVNDVAVIGFHNRIAVTVTNMTMQNAFSPTSSGTFLEGGAIYYDGSDLDNTNIGLLTLTNVKLSANTSAGQGGGVWAGFGSLTVQTTSIVRANTATNQSTGGVAWTGGNTVETQALNITNSTIGGALVADGNQATDPTFGAPGGVDVRGGLMATISGSTIQNNIAHTTGATIGGGGIQVNSPTVAISNTTISNNQSKGNGGGLWSSARNAVTNASSTITLTTVNVTGNQADSDNLAGGDGGGIFNFFGAMTIQTNSHVDGNSAVNGGGIFAGWSGIAADPTAGLTVSSSTIGQAGAGNGNNAKNNGGSIAINPVGAVSFNPINLNTLTFTNNTANSDSAGGGDGGAIFVGAGQLTSLNGCTIDGNVANGGLGDGIRQTGGTITGAGTLSVNGGDSLHLSGGTFTSTSGTLNLTGNLTRDTGHTFTHNSGTVTFNGSGAQTMNGTATSLTLNNFIVNKSGGSTLNTGGSLATITTATYTNTLGNFTAPTTMDINGLVTLTAGTFTSGTNITAAANWTNNGGTFAGGTGTVTFDGAVAQQINGSAVSQTFNNVVVNKGSSSTLSTGGSTTSVTVNNLTMSAGTFTAPATLDINGNTTLNSGSTLTAGANITAGGSWTNNAGAVFTPGTGTVTFDSNTAANLGGTTSPQNFNNFTVNKPGGTLSGVASLSTLTLLGSMNIIAGTLNAGTITNINVPGNWGNTGTFTPVSSTVTLNGVGNVQTLTGSTTFNNLTSNHTGAGNVTSVGSTFSSSGLMRVQAGTFNIGDATLTNLQIDNTTSLAGTNATTINVAGNWTNNSSPGFTANGNTVNFNGGGVQSLGGTATTQTFSNFTVNKGGGSALMVVASTTTLDINGNVTLTAGGFTAGTATAITVAGNWTNNGGTFTPGTGTVTFDGGAGQTIGGSNATTFNNLTNGNAAGLAMNNNNNVNGALALTSSDITVAAAMTLTQLPTPASTGTFDVVGNVRRTNSPNPLPTTALTFGNPFNSITFTASGTRPTDVTVNLVKAVPSGGMAFPTAVQRTYTITPTGGSGFSATVRLHYLDAELNGNVEAELGLWRFGAAWARQGRTGAVDTTNNWAELSGVTQFSPWTLSSAKNDTTTTITSDTPDPSIVNQVVPVNYTVVSNVAGAPTITGNVTITVNDASGDTCTGTVAAGTCNLTLTTLGSKTLTATYSNDANFNGSSDTEAHDVVPVDVNINDAKVAEPTSGTTNMVFTVTLSAPAPIAGSVAFQTADVSATAGVCGSGGDYTSTSGTVNFAVGQQIKTISVPVCADATPEPDETFLVNLSAPDKLTIVDGQATGTITPNAPGTLLISEVRTSGPSGAADEFVEIYNNTDSPHVVTATNGSTGYGVFKMGADCNANPILVGTIPNGTNIPARGHYLLVGAAYSLANYGGTGAAAGNLTMSSDIENDRNVSLFSTTNILALSTITRFDAVGFGTNTGNACDLQREGTNLGALLGSTLQYSFFRKECDFVLGVGCTVPGRPKDSNNNANDFLFADTAATLVAGAGQHLGAPGPQNLASPLRRDPTIGFDFLDSSVADTSPPNQVRDLTSDPANNSTLGTLLLRTRVINNTGANVTRLRFRVIELTTAPPPGGIADLRLRNSVTQAGVGPINDAATCAATGSPATPPCTATVNGLTLETPPAQAMGGGYNSTVSAGTITVGTPLATGASTNVQFLLGIQQTGNLLLGLIVESLPNGGSAFLLLTGGADSLSVPRTTTTLGSDVNPSGLGQQVTFTASVAENPSVPSFDPTGTVDFIDTSNGNAVICNDVPLNGSFQATCQTSSLTLGTHNIRADYSGDGFFQGSQSNVVPQVVNPAVSLTVSVQDAKVAEPSSGSTNMVFTVALDAPAPGAVSVNFQTSDGTANDGVGEGNQDYTATSGTVNFIAGQQLKTINVPVLSDADNAEVDETFTVTLSGPSGAVLGDATATGTITVANTPGTLLISEVRTSGPSGSADEFVEIYNNTNSPHVVTATNGSTGYGVFKMGADCNATPILVGTIPNGTTIPARGHYLLVGSAYSLADYGGTGNAAGNLTMSSDIENDRNVSLFSTTNILALGTTTRFDAVGFGTNMGNVCDLQREGTNLGPLAGSSLEYSFVRKLDSGTSQDTNDNAADFVFIDTAATATPAGQRLGAPGPENLASPIQRNATIKASLVDPGVASTLPPNRVRDTTSDPANNSTFGTLDIRRKFTNNTGGAVTRLRFRIVDVTTAPPPVGTADLRARNSVQLTGVMVSGGGTITIEGLTLEQPPTQTMGGGLNSTLSAGTVTMGTPIAPGAGINLHFLLGVQQNGNFRFFINVEALP